MTSDKEGGFKRFAYRQHGSATARSDKEVNTITTGVFSTILADLRVSCPYARCVGPEFLSPTTWDAQTVIQGPHYSSTQPTHYTSKKSFLLT